MKKFLLLFTIAVTGFTGAFSQTIIVAGADAGTLAGNPYTTLKAAFDNINVGSQTGNVIIITIAGNTTESASASLNAGTWTSVLIIPVGISGITGNIAGGLVNLNGANNVTIDGLNTGGNSLAINNSNTAFNASAVRLVNDASNNIVRRCNLLGSCMTMAGSTSGVVEFNGGLVTGNDNNTIELCNISASSGGNPANGIYSLGTSTAIANNNNTLSNNNISDYFNAGNSSSGIILSSSNTAWTILNNTLYQTATRTYTTANIHYGIRILSGSGYTISNNFIGFAAPNQTGTTNMIGLNSGSLGGSFPSAFTAVATANTTSYVGINCAFTAGGTVSSIQNNTIGGLALYTSSASNTGSGMLCGIAVTSGNADIGTITGNTIGSASGSNSIYAASISAGGVIAGIYCTSANTINIQNNIIGGIDVSGTTAGQAAGFKGIDVAGTGNFTVSNNQVGNATANNIRTGYLLTGANLSNTATTPTSASGGGAIRGIVSSATGTTVDISNNMIRGIQISGNASSYTGISTTGTVTSTMNITANQVGNSGTNAVTFAFTTGGTIAGVSVFANAPVTTSINNNSIYGITCPGANSVTGITTLNGNASATLNINNNSLINITVNGVASSTPITVISNSATVATLNITGNIIRSNSSTAVSGNFNGIVNSAAVVNTININNNQLGNAGGGAITLSAATTGAFNGIRNIGASSIVTININNNSIDGINCVSTGQFMGIYNSGNTINPVNIKNNQLGTATGTLVTFNGAQSNSITVINNSGGGLSTTVSIQDNDIRGITHSVTGAANHEYIFSDGTPFSVDISNNTFTNLSVNTSGNVTFINHAGFMDYFSFFTCSNNRIVTAFAKTAAGGQLKFYTNSYLFSHAEPYVSMTVTGNNFSNVTVTGATGITGFSNTDFDTNIIYTGNTFNNITGGSGDITIMNGTSNSGVNCTSNVISNITGTGAIIAIDLEYAGYTDFASTTCGLNNIFNLVSSGSGGNVKGIIFNPSNSTGSIFSNNISGLSSTGLSANVMGIEAYLRGGANIYGNVINTLSCSGTGAPLANGITVGGRFGTYGSANVFYNKIYDILQSGVISSGSTVINGIAFTTAGSGSVTAHNNFVADLKATQADLADAICGISVSSATTNMNYNFYYNSVYINAASTGTNFGSTGIYHLTNATATTARLNLINNIIVNTSTANGTGVTAAYRRSDAILTNYGATSDNNLFYAGTPSATNLIYYDGTNSDLTLANYQARVSTRDANSISLMPIFVSATDLHLTNANCRIDGRGKPVTVTTDIDGTTRDASAPDIGADEFTATYGPALAGIVSTAVCDNKTVSTTGTYYATSVCDLIARIVPSGAVPVAGKINACVTLDATQLYFNAQPYVQRHYDIEPAVGAATASATVTLYFNDAEFALYNTNNSPVWPALPTIAGGGNGDGNIANVKVTQFHGTPSGGLPTSTPGNYSGSRVLLTPISVVLTGTVWAVTVNVAGFSGFYVHTNFTNTPLPVTINYFTGRNQGSKHLLNWKVTCNSTPRVTMVLERSADSRNFTGINSITADAVRCNQPFDHTDTDPLKGMNYYRLKMTDADGKISYSSIVALLNAVKGFDIISIAPNPVVDDHFKLNVASAQAGKMDIAIFDMQGRLVNRQTISLIAGFNALPMNVANLSPGTYTIQGTIDDDKSKLMRFVKQ